MPKKKSRKRRQKSQKGALIKGMSRRLPSDILGNPIFRKRLKEIMKGYAGIYALYKKKRLYDVGLTRNLFGRINWHLNDRHAGRWDQFIIFRIKRVNYLKDIETLLTHLVDTRGNRVKGNVPRDADISRVLRDILRLHKQEIRGIEKALKK